MHVAIVGGGASGLLTAAQIARQARHPLSLTVVGGAAPPGRGLAYATTCSTHLLNVRAERMSAWPHEPADFVHWLATQPEGRGFGPASFVPRALYGRYLEDVLATAVAAARVVRFEWLPADALDIAPAAGDLGISLEGRPVPLVADHVVLAVGPVTPPARRAYAVDPWSPGALDALAPDGDVLVLGTGLTMVDVVLALRERGHRGAVTAVSRHALLPAPHDAPCACGRSRTVIAPPPAARAALAWVRELVRRAEAEGCGWRCVLDSLRPLTGAWWRRLPHAERQRFLRHTRSYWDVHRHRLPPPIADLVSRMRADGSLRIRAGRLVAVARGEKGLSVRVRDRASGRVVSLAVDRVFDATGAYGAEPPLVSRLRARGLVRGDALGLGLDATLDGRLVGGADGRLWTLGPPLRGLLWETTAIPEIREQARARAASILAAAEQPAIPATVQTRDTRLPY